MFGSRQTIEQTISIQLHTYTTKRTPYSTCSINPSLKYTEKSPNFNQKYTHIQVNNWGLKTAHAPRHRNITVRPEVSQRLLEHSTISKVIRAIQCTVLDTQTHTSIPIATLVHCHYDYSLPINLSIWFQATSWHESTRHSFTSPQHTQVVLRLREG